MSTRLRRLLVVLLGPLWVRTFRDPVREGRLRLDGLSSAERQLARFGLVLLGLLLVSVLFSDLWRSGTLLQLSGGGNDLSFVPRAVLPVTLVGLLLAWALLAWGALDAAPSVRLLVAFLYLSTTASTTVTTAGLGTGSWILENAGWLVRIGAYGVPAVLVLSALLHPLVRSRPRAARVVVGVLRVLVVAGLVVHYGSLQWANLDAERLGLPSLVPGLLDGTFGQVNAYLVPLVYVAAVAVIDFGLDVSSSLTEPARVLRRRWLLGLLVALLTVKLVEQVVRPWETWRALVTYQPVAFWRTVVSVLLLAALTAVVTRFPPSEDYQLAKERTSYGAGFVLAASSLLAAVASGFALFLLGQFRTDAGQTVLDRLPLDFLSTEGVALAGLTALVAGVWLMRRSAGGYGDELGSALVLVGAWVTSIFGLNSLGFELGFSFPTVDLVVTLGAVVVLVAGWRRLSPAALVALGTVVLFSWLVTSRGDYLSFLGGLVGLSAILVVVFGVVLTLASGSSFASEGSRRLPADARPLLWVGYLLLSVVILHWLEVTHEEGQDQVSLLGFYAVGIPMAFWLAGRRLVRGPDPTAATD